MLVFCCHFTVLSSRKHFVVHVTCSTSLYLVADDIDAEISSLVDSTVSLSNILDIRIEARSDHVDSVGSSDVGSGNEHRGSASSLISGATSHDMVTSSSSNDMSYFDSTGNSAISGSRSGDSRDSLGSGTLMYPSRSTDSFDTDSYPSINLNTSFPSKSPTAMQQQMAHKNAFLGQQQQQADSAMNLRFLQQQVQHQAQMAGQHQRGRQQMHGNSTVGDNNCGMLHTSSAHFALASEDAALFRDFKNAFESKNVASAVAALRRIYPKQSKLFRIPELLVDVIPTFTNPLTVNSVGYAHTVFLLKCTQWCFGLKVKRKGESVDSFKYNMNKNIACWLMQVLYDKLQGFEITTEMKQVCVDTICVMLDNVCELDFALEIMQHMGVNKPVQILMPYLQLWQNSDLQFLVLRANVFAAKVRAFGGEDVPLQQSQAVIHNSNSQQQNNYQHRQQHQQLQPMDRNGQSRFVQQQPVPPAFPQLKTPRVCDGLAPPVEVPGLSTSVPGADTIDMGFLLHILGGGVGAAMGATTIDRLVAMILAAPRGLLGSKIPYIYFKIFNEKLDLRGRKLTDVLLSSERVGVFTSPAGSSDRLFKATYPSQTDHDRGQGQTFISPDGTNPPSNSYFYHNAPTNRVPEHQQQQYQQQQQLRSHSAHNNNGYDGIHSNNYNSISGGRDFGYDLQQVPSLRVGQSNDNYSDDHGGDIGTNFQGGFSSSSSGIPHANSGRIRLHHEQPSPPFPPHSLSSPFHDAMLHHPSQRDDVYHLTNKHMNPNFDTGPHINPTNMNMGMGVGVDIQSLQNSSLQHRHFPPGLHAGSDYSPNSHPHPNPDPTTAGTYDVFGGDLLRGNVSF